MIFALIFLVVWFGFSFYYTVRALNGTFLFKNAVLSGAAMAPTLIILYFVELFRKMR